MEREISLPFRTKKVWVPRSLLDQLERIRFLRPAVHADAENVGRAEKTDDVRRAAGLTTGQRSTPCKCICCTVSMIRSSANATSFGSSAIVRTDSTREVRFDRARREAANQRRQQREQDRTIPGRDFRAPRLSCGEVTR